MQMQTFKDPATQQVWAFDHDVIVENNGGVYEFFCNGGKDEHGTPVKGAQLNVPATLQPHTVAAPTDAELLAQAKDKQTAAVSTACANAIQGGFTSSALGDAYGYGSKPNDQTNIALAAISGGNLWCADASGTWEHKAHTASQARQVQKDMAASIQAQQGCYAGLLARIQAAVTIPDVEAVTWPPASDAPSNQPASTGLFSWIKRG